MIGYKQHQSKLIFVEALLFLSINLSTSVASKYVFSMNIRVFERERVGV